MSNAVLKDAELQQYYEALFDMYATPGWRFLMEDIANMIVANDRVAGIKNAEELFQRQGSLQELHFFLNHRRNVEAAYAALLAGQENTEEVAPTGGRAQVVDPNEHTE